MFNLTRQEKIILIFLTVSFVTGLGVKAYKKSRPDLRLSVQPYKITAQRAAADRFIEQQRSVNINSGEKDELRRLPGIGGELAARIIEYRRGHGPFKTKEELLQVKGIGEKKFEKFRELISLSDGARDADIEK